MKKLTICLLCLALTLSLAACGQPADVRGDITPNTTTAATTEATTAATTEATTEPQFAIGSATGNTYKNEFIGIRCTLDSNWVFKTDEEIRAQNQITQDLVGDEYKDALANASIVYDMMAIHTNQTDSINVVMEKLGVTYLLITEEQYLTLSKDAAVGGLQSMGFTIDSAEISKLQFAGAEHAALTIQGNYAGIAIYEMMVVIKCNGYIAAITVATWDENGCLDILNQFQPC